MNIRTEPGAWARTGASPHSQLAPESEIAPVFEIPPAGAYQLDPHESAITFATRHRFGLGAVDGRFRLAAARYPDITFVSTALEARDEAWLLRGRLCVRGHEGPAEACLRASRWDGSLLRIRATATVDRYAFGITAARGLAARRLDLFFEIAARPAMAPGGAARHAVTP